MLGHVSCQQLQFGGFFGQEGIGRIEKNQVGLWDGDFFGAEIFEDVAADEGGVIFNFQCLNIFLEPFDRAHLDIFFSLLLLPHQLRNENPFSSMEPLCNLMVL